MKGLVADVRAVMPEVKETVDARIREFKRNRELFSELCFCILTANYTAEGGIRIQRAVPDFSALTAEELETQLRRLGHRFPHMRAGFIHEAKQHKEMLPGLCNMRDSVVRREWLVENVKGLGYKEASHFLRNTGYMDVAIVDRHILSLLDDYGLMKRPKTVSKKTYLDAEAILQEAAGHLRITQGELDLYMWYMKTGKILK
ncbi:MAG: N-glycosylase/DNA lyase [Candidatus Bilamarchaeaceae archaeon]